ncbi:MAG: D-alanyl-D-alanine carboxypeptidase/D-alanyl-D-alanine-endopeptidase (penicillin-binding protein 4) [Burkholderiaceae bacterium]|jgi:D-alanyl-D-alanine carboxypeptidase/D-alanyl-D-alanine-endopeptidase (penicillin-binding protein 4)
MRILMRLQVVLITLLLAGTVHAGLPAPVAAAFKRAGIAPSGIGIEVVDIATGRNVISLNAELPLNPASTMKLLTTSAALELLGPTYSFTTQAYMRGRLEDGLLQGDLILRGSGDPKLVIENFWLFLRKIRAQGVRDIRGNLVLDRSAFDATLIDPALFDGDPLKAYNAGPDALLLNFHSLAVSFIPDRLKDRVQVRLDPALDSYPVKPPQLTGGDCAGDWRVPINATLQSAGANFDGPYAANCGEKSWQIHPYQLSRNRYLELVFRQLWAELGGTFDGIALDGVVTTDAVLLAQWESPPMPELIRDVNKFSNNVMARQLFLTLASTVQLLPASIAASRDAVARWLAAKQIDASGLVLENGAGLSRIERISSRTLGSLLVSAFRAPTMPEFVSSLPLVGYDGTMRKRLRSEGVSGHAHIKTGSLQDVRSIAGYVQAASGKQFAVVCLINDPNAARGGEAQDALLQWVFENK